MLASLIWTATHADPVESSPGRPPQLAFDARLKARPAQAAATHYRVRHDRIDSIGKVTLRYLVSWPRRVKSSMSRLSSTVRRF